MFIQVLIVCSVNRITNQKYLFFLVYTLLWGRHNINVDQVLFICGVKINFYCYVFFDTQFLQSYCWINWLTGKQNICGFSGKRVRGDSCSSRCSFSVLLRWINAIKVWANAIKVWANAIKVWANAIKIKDQHKKNPQTLF